MPRIILLGTGSALSGADRENTFMLIEGEKTRVLVDCAGSPAQRLARANVDVAVVDHLILTHTHPDHIYGFPIFVLDAWMKGRRTALDVYGLPDALRAARLMLHAVDARAWPDFFALRYHRVQASNINLIFSNDEFLISATMTDHFVPTLALRVTSQVTGASIAYSCDTAPRENIVELARGAKYLFHEATTLDSPIVGHSSAIQAGAQAQRAGVDKLVLVHLPPDVRPTKWRAAARQEFAGPIIVARDLQAFSF